ncbi:carbohydrate-binding protein [Paenibacillaceae bacterium]|nr:carbohydrate-binding protein [Paenibacillaceae bacterium]
MLIKPFRIWLAGFIAFILLAAALAVPLPRTAYANDYQNPGLSIEQRVDDLLSRMTLQEKIGQMLQVERLAATPSQVAQFAIGSVLSGGGSNPTPNNAATWAAMTDSYQQAAMSTRLQIPILYGVDAVHGHNNVYGATIYPHNVGLGASGDADLVRRIGDATAREIRATGVNLNFAPCLCVPQDIRWGRTYEGYSENVTLAGKLGTAFVEGLQGNPGDSGFMKGTKAVASIKHWLGDGNTTGGDDQGNVTLNEQELDPYIQPYRDAIAAGARTVMISLTTWNGQKMHVHQHLITEMLKQDLNFQGIVISDWNGAFSLVNQGVYATYAEALRASVNAGIDLFMEPDNWQQFIPTLVNLVNTNQVSQARINDAVSRILRVKFEAGLFEAPYVDNSLIASGLFGGAGHRALGREAVRKSAVLLKNDNHFLPLSKQSRLFVAGSKAHNIGFQSGGWTISWQGSPGAITPGTTLLQGIQGAVTGGGSVTYSQNGTGAAGHDAAIVVIGEYPSAEMMGDVGPGQPRPNLELSAEDRTLLTNVAGSGVPMVVIMLSGRPMIVSSDLPGWQAFVAAWLPGTEGGGIADLLFGDDDFTGKLPLTWPRSMAQIPITDKDQNYTPLFPYGYGLSASATHVAEVPGLIEAESAQASFDVRTEATLDTNGGLNVGYFDSGDWLDYRIFAPRAGTYQLRLRVASQAGAVNAIEVISGESVQFTASVPNTGGWQTWTTISHPVTLEEGVQTLRLRAASGGWNLNWLALTPTAAASPDNLLVNPGFDSGSAAGWEQWNGGVSAQSVDTNAPYTGTHKLTHWASGDYRQLTRQYVTVPNGQYRFSGWVRTSGGQRALHLYAKSAGRETRAQVSSNATDYWQQYTIDQITVTNGQLEVGVWSDARGGNWSAFDAFELVQADPLVNAGFERGNLTGWTIWHSGTVAQKVDRDQPAAGSYKLTHWSAAAYQQLTSQTVAVQNGIYRLSVWARAGGAHTALQLQAKGYGGSERTATITADSGQWARYTIDSLHVTTGMLEMGVWSDAAAGSWSAYDRFELVPM